MNTSPASLTPDEPYRPSTGNGSDDEEIQRATGAENGNKTDPGAASPWRAAQIGSGRSLLPPVDEDLARLLADAGHRLESGKTLSNKEVRNLAYRGAIRLLGCRRPAAVVSAVKVLAKMEAARSLELEKLRVRNAERRSRRREAEGLRRLVERGQIP